jgi:hypothetical protein
MSSYHELSHTTVRATFESIPHDFIRDNARLVSEDDVRRELDEVLDSESVEVAGYTMWPSEILKKVDPIAYREEFANFAYGSDVFAHVWEEDGIDYFVSDFEMRELVRSWDMLTDEQQAEYK